MESVGGGYYSRHSAKFVGQGEMRLLLWQKSCEYVVWKDLKIVTLYTNNLADASKEMIIGPCKNSIRSIYAKTNVRLINITYN